MASLTVNYAVAFGASVRIGYKLTSSTGDYTYLNFYPSYNQSPYTITGIPLGVYEVQINTICPTCSGGIFSDPVVVQAVAVS
jgi:hypothetical protein